MKDVVTTTGNAFTVAGDALVADARYELRRSFQPRSSSVPLGPRNRIVEGQAFAWFPEIYSDELRSALQQLIDAQASPDARRKLRARGGGQIALLLEQPSGAGLQAIVGPPAMALQPADRAPFPVLLAG